jgi:hypothetical protein
MSARRPAAASFHRIGAGLSAAIELLPSLTVGVRQQEPLTHGRETCALKKRARWIWLVSKLLPDLIKLRTVKQ